MADSTDDTYIPDGPNTQMEAEDVSGLSDTIKRVIRNTVPALGFLSLVAAVIASDAEPKSAAEYGLTNEKGDPTWVYNMFTDPVGWVEDIIKDLIFESVLEPIGSALWNAGVSTVDSFIVIIFGTDRAIGVAEGSQFGLLDIPFAFVKPVVGFVVWMTDGTVGVIVSFNGALAASFSSTFGIASPIVFNFIVVGEVVVLAAAGWAAINAIDIPVVRVMAVFNQVTAPFRRFLRWFK